MPERLCHHPQETKTSPFVIPGMIRNPFFFKVLQFWMPDQVQHDGQKSNAVLDYDTVCCTEMTRGQLVSDLPEICRL
jgi:hypothetical protein